ncbi:N-acetylneuraminate synthase [Eubacterium callanderi]|uniref:N,N'-diacetyllegionaminic acid synthase n=1 Tax=Eubacterium limosum TaxID=1736 RepID=A0A6N3HMQ3_EUBLI|nr:N-acetylneuraminate synthase [Eubacterium callanderi]MBO1700826.1 N-acetylneuraminate synthase [Eubacterium callanderi]MDR4075151.1 N-acetylneuraminate synthase [Eubacterium sp.]
MKVYIIAEAGVNHNGSLKLAKEMVIKARESGADAIKFQTFKSERVVSSLAKKAAYQIKNTGSADESQLEMVKKLELSFDDFRELQAFSKEKDIQFLSTPFDLESIDFLNQLEMPFWKLPSGEVTNYPYLVKIAQTHKGIVMSTGMCTLDEISESLSVLRTNGAGKIVLLHCNTEYPTPMEDVNLKAMSTLKKTFDTPIGYSDHTKGIEVPIAAVAMGATIIEKHFTLDRNMEGPDHKASLEPSELKAMVQAIRNIEKAIGTGKKKPSVSEVKNIVIARKSIVANQPIKKGEIFTEQNITTKRPGTGISPMKWRQVLGQKATRDFTEDELIEV